jgi:hypothetical protein
MTPLQYFLARRRTILGRRVQRVRRYWRHRSVAPRLGLGSTDLQNQVPLEEFDLSTSAAGLGGSIQDVFGP